jgi:hypothetical protein
VVRLEPARAPRRGQRGRSAPEADRPAEEAAPNGAAADGAAVKLFVNRGERSGIDEDDLRWAMREGAVVPEESIRDVRVLHRFSFVEIDPEHAERAVEFLDGTKLKGKEIRLEVARK